MSFSTTLNGPVSKVSGAGGGLLALLVVEFVLVTVWFDRWQMASEHGWLLFGSLNTVLRIGVAIATATAIVAAARRRPQPGWASLPVGHMRRAWLFLVGHMVALAGFVVLSELVFKENTGVLPDAEITVGLWVVVGLMSMALWVAAFLSTSDGGRLWRRGLHALPLGTAQQTAKSASSRPMFRHGMTRKPWT